MLDVLVSLIVTLLVWAAGLRDLLLASGLLPGAVLLLALGYWRLHRRLTAWETWAYQQTAALASLSAALDACLIEATENDEVSDRAAD